MRHRNVKGAYEILQLHPKVVHNPSKLKGKWHSHFQNDGPIMIEIGMGKGQFITELAKENPHINYIGFEKFTSIMAKALEKIDEQEPLHNLIVIREDAENLLDLFEEGEIEGIYLNFSDPWPKERHIKRRLTSKTFLEKYAVILKAGSHLIFKTDNKGLFEFSLEQINDSGYEVLAMTYDLHGSSYVQGNIMTEYEKKFVAAGMNIHMVRFQVKPHVKI
ncbi:MAG: tRNA (guanosine(46)-N7)-methyltransferase TrmB [Vallitaleaceae bacterium]|nr:tRNA (guanosine(46)-N7)-methyltransferase TrmB [Vallitaleaceae bacterium]